MYPTIIISSWFNDIIFGINNVGIYKMYVIFNAITKHTFSVKVQIEEEKWNLECLDSTNRYINFILTATLL